MNNPAIPQATNRGPSHPSGAANGTESADKNCSRFMPRNPLISLDSDERIQGNPRNPTLMIGVFAAKQRRGKKTQMDRPGNVAAEKEPNRLHPKAKRPKGVGHAANPAAFSSQGRLI